MSQRMEKAEREQQLMAAALVVAREHGYVAVSRKQIGTQAGVSECLVSRYFGNMDQVRDNIVKHACAVEDLRIISEALVHKHPAAKNYIKKNKAKIRTYLGLN